MHKRRTTLNKIALIVGLLLYLSACNYPTQTENESYNLFQDLEAVKGADEVQVTINQGSAVGRDAYFEFEVENIQSEILTSGTYDGWCIDWTKPIAQQGDIHNNLKMYSTFGKEKWKPLNYFLNIKDELKLQDPELGFAEFQAVIWSVQEGPDFNINELAVDELPPRLLKNGEPIFNKEKVNAIVEDVKKNSPAFTYTSSSQYALFLKTGDDEQDVMIPSDPPAEEEEAVINIIDLGNINGFGLNEAYAINDEGQITGTSAPMPRREDGHIFIWDEMNGMTAIDQYPDAGDLAVYYGYDINESGIVVGGVAGQQGERFALKWTPETGFDQLGDGVAHAINNSGVAVGSYEVDTDSISSIALVWDEQGNEYQLPTLADYTSTPVEQDFAFATDINNSGQIVGNSLSPGNGAKAVIWEDFNTIREIGSLGGTSYANAINNQGQVVGSSLMNDNSDSRTAFVWDNENGFRTIEAPEGYISVATDINDEGQVVGYFESTSSPTISSEAFYWDSKHGVIQLPPLGDYEIGYAYSINNNGEIVGYSSDEAGHYMAVRWSIHFENQESQKISSY